MRRAAALVGIVVAVALAPAAWADWPHEVKWDQLEPDAQGSGAPSFLDGTVLAVTADDFLCTETGWITDIEFNGWFTGDIDETTTFRVSFWDDVPATPDEESHPGNDIWNILVQPASPEDPLGLGWKQTDEAVFKINLPECDWFLQEEGTIYWISIVATVHDGWFFWTCRDRNADVWNDAAAFAKPPEYAPWWHCGWPDSGPDGLADVYETTLPVDWDKSADMSFRLTGTPIPEPATLGLVTFGAFALLFRRKR